jgi:hypothetical protein
MILTRDIRINRNETITIFLPNFREDGKILEHIRFEGEHLAMEVSVSTNGNRLLTYGSCYFGLTDTILLQSYNSYLERGQDVQVEIKARGDMAINLKLYAGYATNHGALIYEESYQGSAQRLSELMSKIAGHGRMTQLIITCNQPIKEGVIVPLYKCDHPAWLSPLRLDIMDEGNQVSRVVIDLHHHPDGALYARHLRHLQLQLTLAEASEESKGKPTEPIFSILAFGYK